MTGKAKFRFLKKVARKSKRKCWEWRAARSYDGYGIFSVGGVLHRAHRFSWELFKGRIPRGRQVCHRCNNPSCVNPAHLYLGTNAQNHAQKIREGRQAKGVRQGLSKLTEGGVRRLRQRYATGAWTYRELAYAYGVSHATIGRVVQRLTWRHI